MTKEIRRIYVTVERHIGVDVLVDKDVPNINVTHDIESHFSSYGDDWDMEESTNAYLDNVFSLREYLMNPKRDAIIYEYLPNKDIDCLQEWDEMDADELQEEEQTKEREARDNAAQMKLEV